MKRITSPIVIFMNDETRFIYSLIMNYNSRNITWPTTLNYILSQLGIEAEWYVNVNGKNFNYLNESQLDYL